MMKNQWQGRGIAICASLLLGLSCAAAAAPAGSTSDAARKLAAEQSEVGSLTQQLAQAQSRLGETQVADLFGPSDEEKAAAAAAAQHEQAQDSSIANLNQRADDLQDSIRKLTGEIEVLNHRLDEMDQHIERVRKEFQYKQLGAAAAPGAPDAIPCNPAGDASGMTMPPPGGGAGGGGGDPAPATTPMGVTHLAPGPGVLGTLPQSALNAPPQPPASAPGTPPANQVASLDPRAQFDSAMNLLAKSQYDEARSAFRSFADTYPKDPLAAQALYWLGDIAYVQKDYAFAARAFVEELKKFPNSSRAPESMLKLGQSLLAMNQKDQGCMALHALVGKYPTASKNVLGEAEAVRKAGGCKR